MGQCALNVTYHVRLAMELDLHLVLTVNFLFLWQKILVLSAIIPAKLVNYQTLVYVLLVINNTHCKPIIKDNVICAMIENV